VIVGVFVIVALAALGVMIYKFGELPTVVSKIGSFQVKVQFPTASGVQKDTPIQFCGFQIGKVTAVNRPKVMRDLNTGNFYHQTLVILSIDKKYNDIPADVEAKLMSRGLGSSYIELKLKHFDISEPTGPFLNKKSLLQGSTGMTSEFFPEESQKKLQELVDGLRTFINNANNIIGDPNNKKNINKTLANLAEASQYAAQALQEANKTLVKAADTMEDFHNLASAGTTTLKNVDTRINEFVPAIVHTSEELSKATSQLRVILEKINTGQGTAARFLNDGKFYEQMLENTKQIELLLQQLKAFIAQSREKGLPLKLK